MTALRRLFAAWLAAFMAAVPTPALSQAYQARRGDTLCDLSVRFEMPVEALAQANAYEDMTRLFDVSTLWIQRYAYRIKPNDRLADIAEDHRTTVAELLWLTELEVKPLVDGAIVILPSAPPWGGTSPARRTWRASPICVDFRRSGGEE